MGLISLPPEFLKLHTRIPFGVYDGHGRLLVAAGRVIEDERKLASLLRRELFVDAKEAGPWRASFTQTAQDLIQQDGATLAVIAAARLDGAPRRAAGRAIELAAPGDAAPSGWARSEHAPLLPAAASVAATAIATAATPGAAPVTASAAAAPTLPVFSREGSLPERCAALIKAWHVTLRDAADDPHWLSRTLAIRDGVREFARFHRDAAIYMLLQHAAHSFEQYCAHHTLLCMLMCEAVALKLGFNTEERDRLGMAALTMNVSMAQLQDQLAQRDAPLRDEQRQSIKTHPDRSAQMLLAAGVTDEDWLAIVRMHHDPVLDVSPLSVLDSASRLAKLLSMTDRFTAKISRRGSRHPMSPLAAARDVCVGLDGQPDPLGSALLKVLGMYPPGSYVRLASGEVGVVVASGRRMNQPLVAVFVAANGMPTTEPLLRDAAQQGRAVQAAVRVSEVRVRVNPDRALALA